MNSTSDDWRQSLAHAIELFKTGNHEESKDLLENLADQHPGVAAIQGFLGRVYFGLCDYDSALRFFRRATNLNPDSELAALGLYQCLVETGRVDDAMEEMRRYTSSHVSEDFRLIAQEAGFSLDDLHVDEG